MLPSSLRARMMLLFCVVVGILLAGSYFVFYSLFARQVHRQIDHQLVETAEPVAADLASDPTEKDVNQLNLPGNYFEVLSVHGRLLQRSINLAAGSLGITGDLPASRPAFRTLYDPHYGKLRVALVPFARGGETQVLAVAVPSAPADRSLTAFRGIVWWLLPLSLLLTAIIAHAYVGRGLEPVRRLTAHARQTAGRMAESPRGDLWTPIAVRNPRDELGRLAETFNTLFGRVDATVRQLRQFATDASHELRTPLSVIRGEVELVLSKPRPAEEYMEALRVVEGEMQKLSRIAEGLFTLSMADAGRLRLNLGPVYLNEVLEEACACATPLAQAKKITIERELSTEAACQGDEAFLRELFLVFLDNAIKYSPCGSSISVGLARKDGLFRVTFADQGCGIAESDAPHIFERFYRGASASDSEARSGGLGLAIAKAIAHAHGGSIECVSRPSAGSTFTVALKATNSPA